ncbi:acyl carrier protein [Burkholderia gladioli pv. gladioli]|uniref:Phosphopantetheine attachment site family protein n=1 Tax=Burkholderia gladioli TaxID=28095 RepID=A0A095F421_BURGA|nr:acyl carrier protein [Burkholderia gladioli]AJX00923.1 phosphopantetheine attachment site family protein [Burkholderia gladioli]ASD80050.1 phosphopantetheine-binding protein [Burkholderia gladioli pv. gladioli]AWY54702.1 phosphopantetheine-binding protein [Burkholderia gladioli pv. gladioli]KGC11710.1 phosphopantetheine attachment site family protein [Burkholderia gladioli]MDJ1160336.1 acyl carrier protein [Burkholderia gladioli pv. gladioli]
MTTHNTHGPGREEISATIRSCLLSAIGSTMAAALIADDTNLFDVGVDSMNMTDLLLQLEQRFGFTLAPEDLSADLFLRFGNLVSFVESHVRRN